MLDLLLMFFRVFLGTLDTDNGKEFTGNAILKCLRQMNPNILTITGRPRVPRDQGSVESMNKTVKRVLQAQLAERRLRGEDPNWTEILGSVASCVNSQCGQGKYEETSYKAVMLEERIDMS